ncbi:MAG: thioesterase family protein [Burkholderiaceae bacterium]
MAWADYRHRIELRVRWAEVDMQGVVFNGHYLTYCDVCLTEYWRAIGLRYPEDLVAHGSDTFARKITIEYHAPAVYDDVLEVCGRVSHIGRSSMRFAVEIFRKGATASPLVGAELVYVNADPVSRTSQPWPDRIRELMRGYERIAPQDAAHGAR